MNAKNEILTWPPPLPHAVAGFYDAVRENILTLLTITFQRISKAVLASYLSLQSADLDKLVRIKP